MNTLELFCGAGGLSTGFEKGGFTAIGGVDNNKNAVETWNNNHSSGEAIQADLETSTPAEIQERLDLDVNEIKIMIGGPPCQDISNLNKTLHLGRENLVVLFAEYINEYNPDAFVMENVRQLTTTKSDVLDDFYSELDDEYCVSHRLLDAADYGTPQHRIRAFVIGFKKEKLNTEEPMFPKPTHGPDSHTGDSIKTAGEALKRTAKPDNPSDFECTSKHAPLLEDIPPGMNYQFYTEKMGHPNPEFEWRSRFSDFLYKADPEKPVRTLKANPGAASGPFHWDNRRFTGEELKALHGFPDEFTFPVKYTPTVKQIGNAVPPPLAEALAVAVKEQLSDSPDDSLLIPDDEDLGFHGRRRTDTEEYKEKAKQRLKELGYSNLEFDV